MAHRPRPSASRRTKRDAAGGFSIVELILWLLVLTAIAAIAVPRYFERDVTLENGAVLLANDLRAAQNRAAFSGQILFLRFFEDGDGYEVVGQDGEPIADPRTGRPFVRVYSSDGVFEGLRIVELHLNDEFTLMFTPSGETSSQLDCVLEFQDETRHLSAARSTGIVTIEDSTSGFEDLGY